MAQTSGIGAADGTGAEQGEAAGQTQITWCEDDLWLFRRLGLKPPEKLCIHRPVEFPEVPVPDAEHAWVKLELSNISKEGRNRFVRARVQNETRLLILDFVVIDLRDAWPTIELAAKTRLLNAVVHVDSAGQPRKEAPAAGGYPIVKLGPGGDFTRDISPEDLRLRRQAAGGAA